MQRQTIIVLILLSSLLLAQNSKEESYGKFSGSMFSDYYYNIDNHDSDLKDLHGFWFRRIYFTYDYKINNNFSTRLRIDMSNDGKFKDAVTMSPVVKDAYLAYKFGNHKAYFGISPTPTFSLIEKVWRYRAIEKNAVDLQRMASSRDFGLSLAGKIGAIDGLNYNLMFANGSSNKQEIDKGKSFMASVSYWATNELVFELYGDYADKPGKADTYTSQAFLGYNSKTLHGGIQYSHQVLQSNDDATEDGTLKILSVFMSGNITKSVKLIGRVDRMFDANADGSKVAYTPFDNSASFTELIAGVDINVAGGVSIIPNIIFVKYDKNDNGNTPDSDAYAKVTMYWKFN